MTSVVTGALIVGGAGLAGSAISAGASVYGANQAADAATDARHALNDPFGAPFDPRNDPLTSQLSYEDALNLGYFRPDTLNAASPIDTVGATYAKGGTGVKSGFAEAITKAAKEFRKAVDAGVAAGETDAQIGRRIKRLENNKFSPSAGPYAYGMSMFLKAAGKAGFASRRHLIEAQRAFITSTAARTANGQAVAGQVAAGRDDARLGIADLQSNFITPTRASIEAETGQQQAIFNKMLMEQGNAGGFNPAPNILLSRNSALQNALTLLGGQQNLQTNALNSLQTSLLEPQRTAQGTLGVSTGANISAGQIASQQTLELQRLANQNALDAARAKGAGTTGAANSLNSGIQLLAQLNALNGGNQAGATKTTTDNGWQFTTGTGQ